MYVQMNAIHLHTWTTYCITQMNIGHTENRDSLYSRFASVYIPRGFPYLVSRKCTTLKAVRQVVDRVCPCIDRPLGVHIPTICSKLYHSRVLRSSISTNGTARLYVSDKKINVVPFYAGTHDQFGNWSWMYSTILEIGTASVRTVKSGIKVDIEVSQSMNICCKTFSNSTSSNSADMMLLKIVRIVTGILRKRDTCIPAHINTYAERDLDLYFTGVAK